MRVGFYSCMSGMPWGGSEELWWRTARKLQIDGCEVVVNYKWWPEMARQLVQLQDSGGKIYLRDKPKTYWEEKLGRAKSVFGQPQNGKPRNWLEDTQPEAVLVTLGFHPDRIDVATDCLEMGIPYAINVQCASNTFFIHSDCLDEYRMWYSNATKVYFVSEENRQKVETNLAIKLTNYEIVANPFNMKPTDIPDYPSEEDGFRVACVGRIHFQSKGQDVAIDVFNQDKWKQRNIKVNFYGADQGNRRQLEDLIELHGLQDQLVYRGYKNNITEIWAENHALLLPSRYEGAPLVIVESMLCNRIAIATDIGRNRELLQDGTTGFIAESATCTLLDDALERAWQARDKWQEYGQLAGQYLRANYTLDPIGDFAENLKLLTSPGQLA